ncbi:Uma2 family endonuclease [Kitasatospora fiedleri]|uniref:Uma2 family endonuclease n=1 Tax=Kitasatospora fiedleri TaxID=2991545 RepID=UPI00249C3D89|nr:Uma2 family endonuclease [Kitasatospora fiedleri]
MSAATYDTADVHRSPEDDLLKAFLALDTPEGFKAELFEGGIVVTPPPDGDHEGAIGRIVRQVFRLCDADITFAGNKGLIVPGGRFTPDGTFAHEGAFDGRPAWMKPDGIVMVLEVTSSNPAKDRWDKRKGYAAAGIPLYLLVDRKAGKVVLHSHPESGEYAATTSVPFGDPLPLPKPFGFDLATDRLA